MSEGVCGRGYKGKGKRGGVIKRVGQAHFNERNAVNTTLNIALI